MDITTLFIDTTIAGAYAILVVIIIGVVYELLKLFGIVQKY